MEKQKTMQDVTQERQSKPPIAVFRYGYVSASVFENEREYNGRVVKMHSVVLQKHYKDNEGNWRHAGSFDRNDLQCVQMAVEDANRFLFARKSSNSNGEEPEAPYR